MGGLRFFPGFWFVGLGFYLTGRCRKILVQQGRLEWKATLRITWEGRGRRFIGICRSRERERARYGASNIHIYIYTKRGPQTLLLGWTHPGLWGCLGFRSFGSKSGLTG